MKSATLPLASDNRSAMNPWFIGVAVIVSTLIGTMGTTNVGVARPYIAGGLSALTCSWVMHTWVVKGSPELGSGKWRAFIIAATSGGICGALDMCMVEVAVHSPGRPWAAKAAAGTRIRLAAIRAESDARSMTFPMLLQGQI